MHFATDTRTAPALSLAVLRRWVMLLVFLLTCVAPGNPMRAEPSQPASGHAEPAQPPAHSAAEEHPIAAEGAEDAHPASPWSTVAKVLNFAILIGVLVYFLRAPVAAYLASRSTQIRQDLVTAADMRAEATAQLAAIAQQVRALPAELDELKARGAEDVAAERARIDQAAGAERDRLLDHTRREIDMQLRVARRGLVDYAAQLAVDVARARITSTITTDDQLRLADRYAAQLREAR